MAKQKKRQGEAQVSEVNIGGQASAMKPEVPAAIESLSQAALSEAAQAEQTLAAAAPAAVPVKPVRVTRSKFVLKNMREDHVFANFAFTMGAFFLIVGFLLSFLCRNEAETRRCIVVMAVGCACALPYVAIMCAGLISNFVFWARARR